ncbi:uncharacterized protein insb [Drosophila tropicalis]|uniref:uncharacterized protein insb n=1 Tax=Drosophila tropicalis TaxID=46794 RepID=UPI0035AB8EDE
MSGKIIMKRKWSQQAEEQQQQQQPEEDVEQKRHRPDSRPLTPPAEAPDTPPNEEDATDPHSILFEALQKIMELQAELEGFENDLDEREEDEEEDQQEAALNAEVAENFEHPSPAPVAAPQRSQAEALGFAMCARETLLFLQSEGISTESVLYKALLGKLVGQSDGLLQA